MSLKNVSSSIVSSPKGSFEAESSQQQILAAPARPTLRKLAKEKTLCAFDFDGTLAPIVDHPALAGMRERTHGLLNRLTSLYPCIILSGRARADLLNRLATVTPQGVIGNHGAEADAPVSGTSRLRVQEWKAALEMEIGAVPGVWIEDKGLSLAIHYRQSTEKASARARILRAARALKDVRILGGKQVINLVQQGAPNKAMALAAERDRLGCRWVLFVGDDENDEDAFALKGNIVPVRVGRKKRSHARYFLRSQLEIDKLLEILVDLREAS